MDGLAGRLQKVRKEKHLTQAEVAEKLNVSFQAVSLWERGETVPDIEKIVEIASLYGVTTDWLLIGKAEELIGTLLFLVHKDASSFVNGVVIPVDGGFSAYSGV